MPPKQPIRRQFDPHRLLSPPIEVVGDFAAQLPEHRDDSPGLFVGDAQIRCHVAEGRSLDQQRLGLHGLPDVA